MEAFMPAFCFPGTAEFERLSTQHHSVIHNQGITALYRSIVEYFFYMSWGGTHGYRDISSRFDFPNIIVMAKILLTIKLYITWTFLKVK